MVIVIEFNRDMPACLDTDTKQKKIARTIAEDHFGKTVKSTQGPRIQGFFSRTMFVTFKDGAQSVLQFRPEPLNMTPFYVARKALGTIVPEIETIRNEALEQDGIMTYHMTMMPGKIWCHAIAGHKTTALPIINKSLGEIFANGYLEDTSATVIEDRLRPHLDLIITSDLQHVKPFQKKAKELSSQLEKLGVLPLWVTHFDLNEMNVLLDEESFHVSGLIDWELSFPQPFGVFSGRIHTLAGEIHQGEFEIGPEFEEAERALWDALYQGLAAKVPGHVFKRITENPELVQLAVEVGTLLDAFQLEDGRMIEEESEITSKALPKYFKYRIPFLRGDAPPYSA